jgi:hypothetical protein
MMNKPELFAEWRLSQWFATLNPLLGVLVGMDAVFLFSYRKESPK